MRYRVIVVEDNSDEAAGLRATIQDASDEVIGIARNGDEALTIAANIRPDAVVMDVSAVGAQLSEVVDKLAGENGAGVVVISDSWDRTLVDSAAAAGAFCYLVKPVAAEMLAANLDIVAQRAAALSGLRKEADEVRHALEVRKLSERAKYVIMERLSLSEEDAFAHLRQKCRNQNKTMLQVSEDIIAADEAFLDAISKDPPKKNKDIKD